jgi:hypothetical protein
VCLQGFFFGSMNSGKQTSLATVDVSGHGERKVALASCLPESWTRTHTVAHCPGSQPLDSDQTHNTSPPGSPAGSWQIPGVLSSITVCPPSTFILVLLLLWGVSGILWPSIFQGRKLRLREVKSLVPGPQSGEVGARNLIHLWLSSGCWSDPKSFAVHNPH